MRVAVTRRSKAGKVVCKAGDGALSTIYGVLWEASWGAATVFGRHGKVILCLYKLWCLGQGI